MYSYYPRGTRNCMTGSGQSATTRIHVDIMPGTKHLEIVSNEMSTGFRKTL